MTVKDRLWHKLGKVDTGLSFFDRALQLVQFVFVGSGGIGALILAKTDPVLKELGWIYWYTIALLVSLICAGIVFIMRGAAKNQAMTAYYSSLAAPKSLVNPLSESFVDMVIPVEDLRLPDKQVQTGKHFRRCKFVGPGVIAILGGSYSNTGFLESGDVLALPDGSYLTGVVALENCIVDQCQFIKISVLTDQNSAKSFAGMPGVKVRGIIG